MHDRKPETCQSPHFRTPDLSLVRECTSAWAWAGKEGNSVTNVGRAAGRSPAGLRGRSRGFPGRYGRRKDSPSLAILWALRGMLQKCHMLQRGMFHELIAEVTECFKARAAMRQGKACVSSRLRRADGIAQKSASLSRGLRLRMISSSAESDRTCSAVSGVRRGSGRRRRSRAAEFETRDFT